MLKSHSTAESLSSVTSEDCKQHTTPRDTKESSQWLSDFVEGLEKVAPIPVRVKELILDTPMKDVTLKPVKKGNQSKMNETDKTIQALREKIAQAKSDFKKEEMKQRVLIRANQWLERENERYEGVTNDILQGRHSVPVDSVALS